MIDVHFEDQSTKKFVIAEEATVGELVKKIQQKLYLECDADSFALFEETVSGGHKIERFLRPEELCPRLTQPSRFLFKKRFFFADNKEDPVTTHMEFIQIREDVLRDRYILTEREHLELAAIDLRVTFGSPDPTKHKAGFLINAKHLPRLLPENYIKMKKNEVWEKQLLEEYQRIAFEPIESDFQGKVRYLARLKELKPDYFGSVFYEATELEIVEKVVKNRVPVLLAVNKNGIHTFRKPPALASEKSSKIAFFSKKKDSNSDVPPQNILMRTNTFQEILGWAVHPPTHTFIYTVPSESEEGVRYSYESELAGDIPDVCQEYVQQIIARTEDVEPPQE
ncbi:MAG: hypothetical protein EZS28_013878 [Streblomastix strix]|uniref:FERM domain-containing protein n=1 Tax=Streblomastix strix TaxID=222440 RepID=A0A5J4W890_9EUKA|nr:MAG: hypothetical protein EZS28_013878 [Streblomastix strix]